MSRTWVYLKPEESKQFKIIAEKLGLSESELTQKLIRMFLSLPKESNPNTCINCQYYQIASSQVIQAFMKLNEALSLVTPEYIRKTSKPPFF
jgi:hypothetical protein